MLQVVYIAGEILLYDVTAIYYGSHFPCHWHGKGDCGNRSKQWRPAVSWYGTTVNYFQLWFAILLSTSVFHEVHGNTEGWFSKGLWQPGFEFIWNLKLSSYFRKKNTQWVSGHYPTSCFISKKQCFGDGFCLCLQIKTLHKFGAIDRLVLIPGDGTSSIDWAQLIRLSSLDGDKIMSPKRCVLNKKKKARWWIMRPKFKNCIHNHRHICFTLFTLKIPTGLLPFTWITAVYF